MSVFARFGPLIVTAIVTAALIGLILIFGATEWPGAADNCLEDGVDTCYCEAISDGIVKQPQNT